MRRFKRGGRFFSLADFKDIADSPLDVRRKELFGTYVQFGRGYKEILDFWAPDHEELVDAAADEFRERHPDLNPNVLMARSVAWQGWQEENPEDAEAFFDAHTAAIWNDRMSHTQKSTFLAVTHALDQIGFLDQVERVTHIKGEGDGGGTNQFRLFVNLKLSALAPLRRLMDGPTSSIHPGYPDSFREDRDSPPRLQVSTRALLQRDEFGRVDRRWEATDRGADIDVDYRSLTEGHLHSYNSDVTSAAGGIRNWERHEGGYGGIPSLEPA